MGFNPMAVGQMTPASQLVIAKASGSRGGRRSAMKRRKKAATSSRSASRPKRKGKRGTRARLVKGSAAAKRYMASIRRKRRK